jgi:DNA-binding FrmR family transcriptional regulator
MGGRRHQSTEEVITRLNKIEGHVKGIKKMAEAGKECEDILIQISAVQAALKKVGQIILNDHLEHCIMCEMEPEERQDAVERLKRAVDKIF